MDEAKKPKPHGRAPKGKAQRKPSDKPKCGAQRKQGDPGDTCQKPAGHGTDHPGEGRCKNHGGATPIKSGRYSKITRPRIAELLKAFEDDPDPLDLLPEVKLLRALILDYIERYDDFSSALIAWWEEALTWTDAQGNEHPPSKPVQVMDILSVAKFITAIGQISERIEKAREKGSVSLETLNRVIDQLGVELVAAVREAKLDEAKGSKLLKIVERRWGTIQLEPGRAGGRGAP